MRKIKFIKKVVFCISFAFILNGCSKDDEEIITKDNAIEQTNKAASASPKTNLLVEWEVNTDEDEKNIYRNYYFEKKVLLEIILCENPAYETWVIPPPKDDEDLPVREKKPISCCMKSLSLYMDCSDVN